MTLAVAGGTRARRRSRVATTTDGAWTAPGRSRHVIAPGRGSRPATTTRALSRGTGHAAGLRSARDRDLRPATGCPDGTIEADLARSGPARHERSARTRSSCDVATREGSASGHPSRGAALERRTPAGTASTGGPSRTPVPAGVTSTRSTQEFELATGRLTGLEFSVDRLPLRRRHLFRRRRGLGQLLPERRAAGCPFEDELLDHQGVLIDLETGEASEPIRVLNSAISAWTASAGWSALTTRGRSVSTTREPWSRSPAVPGSRGDVTRLTFNADGSRLVASRERRDGADLRQPSEWTRLGAIPSDAPDGTVRGGCARTATRSR